MNQYLKKGCKRIVVSILSVTLAFGVVTPISYLKAESISAPAQEGKNSVTVGGTIITFNSISDSKHVVKIRGTAVNELTANITLERKDGFNGATHANFMWEGSIMINGKNMRFDMIDTNKMNMISENKATVDISILPDIDKDKTNFDKAIFNANSFKGNEVKLLAKKLDFIKYENVMSEQFAQQLKNVPIVKGITLQKAGIEEIAPLTKEEKKTFPEVKSVLPAKGLNIPVCNEGDNTVDNIGFVDSTLQIKTKGNCHFTIRGGDNKCFPCLGVNIKDGDLNAFKIKDQATLNQCKIEISSIEIKAVEKGDQTVNCVF